MTEEKGDKIEQRFSSLEREVNTLGDFESKNKNLKEDILAIEDRIGQEAAKREVPATQQAMIDKFTKDIRQSDSRLRDYLNGEIGSSNDINARLNKELEETTFSLGLKHAKGVKAWEDDRDKQLSEINYQLADIREAIETEAVEK